MMKVTSLKCDWHQGIGPQIKEKCIVEGIVHCPHYPEYSFYLLKGYDYKMPDGQRVNFNTVFFSISEDNTYAEILAHVLEKAKAEEKNLILI